MENRQNRPDKGLLCLPNMLQYAGPITFWGHGPLLGEEEEDFLFKYSATIHQMKHYF